MKTDIALSPMVLLKRGVQVAVDCVNATISNYEFSLLNFNSKTEHNSILKTICNEVDYKVLLNTTYRQIKFFLRLNYQPISRLTPYGPLCDALTL